MTKTEHNIVGGKLRGNEWNSLRKHVLCILFAPILEVYSIFPHKTSVRFHFYTTCSFKRFISWKSDNSVHNVIVIGNTCILWPNYVLNVFLR